MSGKLTYKLLSKEHQHSNYDWMNIDYENKRVGKVRGKINGKTLVIYSINIFPEFERRGYAREVINMFKKKYTTIIADRVRANAIGFWVKMGFTIDKGENYIWQK